MNGFRINKLDANFESRGKIIKVGFYLELIRTVFQAVDGQGKLRNRVVAFTSPTPGAPVEMGPVHVRGFAWSGSASIARVEVAFAGGGEWLPARLTGADEPHAWRAWELIWTPGWRGRHVLRCRATDLDGNVQPDRPRWNALGYGANGVQSLIVEVR